MATPLAKLPAVERLSSACIRILGGNPGKFTLQGTNTYLVGTGPRRILIDTGEGRPAWLNTLKTTLEQEEAWIESALISHWHHDHVGGIQDLLDLSPHTRIYKHKPGKDQSHIYDGQVFRTEGATLTAHYTPGHTDDHMTFVLAEEDAMFTADNVLGHGTAVFQDLTAYLQSLAKMKLLFHGRAYPGHGAVLEDGPARITMYIEHRRQREDQVLETLRSATDKAWTVMEIVKVIYSEIPEELHPAAAGGVAQILAKLESEGRVAHGAGDSWRLERSPSL